MDLDRWIEQVRGEGEARPQVALAAVMVPPTAAAAMPRSSLSLPVSSFLTNRIAGAKIREHCCSLVVCPAAADM